MTTIQELGTLNISVLRIVDLVKLPFDTGCYLGYRVKSLLVHSWLTV